MEQYHLKIWEHFSDFIHSEIGFLSLNFSFVLLLSDKSPKKMLTAASIHDSYLQGHRHVDD
jgi:hypothetical protein